MATATRQDARERLDETRAEAAKAWKAFADRRDELGDQEGEPSSDDVQALDELHLEYEEKAEAMGAAETSWLASLESKGMGLVRHKDGARGRKVSDAIVDVLDMKALVSPAGAVLAPDVLDLIVSKARRPHSILALLTQMQTDGDEVRYVAATTETLAAAPVAPGAVKPTTVLTTAVQTAPVQTIATVSEAIDRAVLLDYGLFTQWIEESLADAVALSIENEVISGSGTAPHLRGITATAGIGNSAYTTSPLDSIAAAVAALEAANTTATGIAVNPADWWTMRTSREGTGATAGGYLLGDPSTAGPTTLWGIPVARSTGVTAGTAIVGDWSQATLVVREGATVAWADAHTDLFIRNQAIVRVESRVAFFVGRPSSFVIADLTAT